MIIENIVNNNNFTVVDRKNINLIQQEIEYHLSGVISDETVVSVGKRTGAEIILSGSITRLSSVSFNISVRAISVEKADILGQFSVNVPATAIVSVLTKTSYNSDANFLTRGTLIIRSEAHGMIMVNGMITEYNVRENGVVVIENMPSGNCIIALKYPSGILTEDVTLIVQSGEPLTVYIRKISNDYVFKESILVAYNGNNHNVIIPRGVTEIGNAVFYNISNKKENLTNINTIEIPETVTKIGYNAFAGLENLVNINIPESVRSIDSMAFYGCSSLSSIYISKNVREIAENAFLNCNKLLITVAEDIVNQVK
jgi:hypothetical protein